MTNGQTIRPRHDNGAIDKRYTIRLELCGRHKSHWVARFCDEWIGAAELFADACQMAADHNQERLA